MPAIARWPGTIPAGRVSPQVAISMDWTATMLATAGVLPAPAYPLDGIDLNPILAGRRAEFDRTMFWRQPALRFNGALPQAAVRRGRWKYLRIGAGESLFDLRTDPGERRNRINDEPAIRDGLKRALAQWEATLPSATAEP